MCKLSLYYQTMLWHLLSPGSISGLETWFTEKKPLANFSINYQRQSHRGREIKVYRLVTILVKFGVDNRSAL